MITGFDIEDLLEIKKKYELFVKGVNNTLEWAEDVVNPKGPTCDIYIPGKEDYDQGIKRIIDKLKDNLNM